MKKIQVNVADVYGTVSAEDIKKFEGRADDAIDKVNNGTGPGNDFLGWVNLPSSISTEMIGDINATANALKETCEVVVAVGIGGSYLGAKAVIEALSDSFASLKPRGQWPRVVFAGHNIGEDYLAELKDYLADKQFGIIVISKSGTTTEPAIAFRILKEMLEAKVGKAEAARRIIAITDAKKGALRQLATEEGYKTYVIEDNVGGRFSVLTPVGLLPIAVAGFDIAKLVKGACDMEEATRKPAEDNIAMKYAMTRNALYEAGKKIEILVNYNPKLHYFGEWWKQLYGESEGKEHKGIFPAAVDNSTDLHSMGQWIQDGERTIFETVLSVESPERETVIPTDEANLDGLNYIAGKRVDQVNKMAELGTRIAHTDGGVPNIQITIPALQEEYLGQLIYFFEKACGISGYILGVNPFNQPGVEDYKRNMFALLAKPGYEKETEAIKKRIG
ncbi:MAG: glucose-6-phosphate isomerase [Muribaculaceae bacterium]|nr:glucose-6-phosphate isomerase [Muribaculaceae bacterium]